MVRIDYGLISDCLDETRTARGSVLDDDSNFLDLGSKLRHPTSCRHQLRRRATSRPGHNQPRFLSRQEGAGVWVPATQSASSCSFDVPDQCQVKARSTERPAARPENRGVFLSPGSGVDMFIMGFGYAMLCLRWSLRACAARLRLDAGPGVSNGGGC